MAEVVVKPAPFEEWHGKKGDEVVSNYFMLNAHFDTSIQKYQVDISESELKNLERVTGKDLSLYRPKGGIHPFYDIVSEGYVRLDTHDDTVFDTDNPIHRIKLGILKAHAEVGMNLADAEAKGAMFYIHDVGAETRKKASLISRQRSVREFISKLDIDARRNFVWAVTTESADGITETDLMVKEEEIILNHLDTALALATQSDVSDINYRATVERMVQSKHLRKSPKGDYYYGTELIGTNQEQAAQWLSDSKQSDVLQNFLKLVESKG